MKIAIFSDVHGKLLLPFVLCDHYQQQTGDKIDFILQCGDLGAFPDLKTLDKATIRHAQRDRDELGFHDHFTKVNPKIKDFLDRLDIDMYCVRGNHEDHDFLDTLEAQSSAPHFAIDAYGRVLLCKSGMPQVLVKDAETLDFVGIGRIGDRKGRTDGKFVQEYEREMIRKLRKSKNSFDVLITHDKDSGSERGFGMDEISWVLDNVIFAYHFYGHTGEPFSSMPHDNGFTTSVKVRESEFDRSGVLEDGTMLILEKKKEQLSLSAVPIHITNPINKYSWKDWVL